MAIQLPTNYVDDILDTSKNTKRKYRRTANSDGTYSYTDVTEYTQQGSQFGAGDVNLISQVINQLVLQTIASNDENETPFRFAKNPSTGEFGYLVNEGGADTFHPFRRNVQSIQCVGLGSSNNVGNAMVITVPADAYDIIVTAGYCTEEESSRGIERTYGSKIMGGSKGLQLFAGFLGRQATQFGVYGGWGTKGLVMGIKCFT